MKASDRRQKLLETADKLFNKYGFHPTGIDLIIKESGASKATLYKHFKNKESLIIEVLKNRHALLLSNLKTAVSEDKEHEYPILTIFDIYHNWFKDSSFYGCCFQKASSEYGDENSPINRFCTQSKNDFLELITSSLQHQIPDLASAKIKARGIMILLEGSAVDAQVTKNKDAAIQAKEIAYQMLQN